MDISFKKGSTLILKTALVVIAAIVLAFCIFALPSVTKSIGLEFPGLANLRYYILIGMYVTSLPFFFALGQAFKLLRYIDKNNAFSEASIKALKKIKRSGILMSIFFIGYMPLFYYVAEVDDAPGVILLGMMFVCAPIVVGVFAAVLQRLLRNAIDMKSENELTV